MVEGGSLVAAGAVVAPGTVVKSGELWGGNPAVKMRDLKVRHRGGSNTNPQDTKANAAGRRERLWPLSLSL